MGKKIKITKEKVYDLIKERFNQNSKYYFLVYDNDDLKNIIYDYLENNKENFSYTDIKEIIQNYINSLLNQKDNHFLIASKYVDYYFKGLYDIDIIKERFNRFLTFLEEHNIIYDEFLERLVKNKTLKEVISVLSFTYYDSFFYDEMPLENILIVKLFKIYYGDFKQKDKIKSFSDNEQIFKQDLKRYRRLSKEEETTLLIKSLNGDYEAKNLLVLSNMGLVFKNASNFLYYHPDTEFLDLVQEGTFGLIKAIEKFDFSKGKKLSTYATPWIIQKIQRYIYNNVRTVRIPVYMEEDLKVIKKAIQDYISENYRDPTIKELSSILDMSEEKINDTLNSTLNIVSLEYKFENEDNLYKARELGETVSSLDEDSILDDYFNEYLKSEIMRIIDNMNFSEKELDVLNVFFPLNKDRPSSISEVVGKYNITRQYVYYLNKRILKKLKSSWNIKKLELGNSCL